MYRLQKFVANIQSVFGSCVRKTVDKILYVIFLISTLAACAGSGDDAPAPAHEPGNSASPDASSGPEPSLPVPGSPRYEAAREAARFLTQATFGPTVESINGLLDSGNDYESWIDAQMALPQMRHLPLLEDRFEQIGLERAPVAEPSSEWVLRDLQRSDIWWESAVRGQDQLRQRVAYALSQILVISNVADALLDDSRGVANYHDLLAGHAFGNYRELLEAVTLNPMMGEYLSMLRNEKADPARNIRPDENYAREIMQLFSIGLVELNPDGSVKLDVEGQPVPTYGQDDVMELARVFTGWTHGGMVSWRQRAAGGDVEILPMKAFPDFHDAGAKTLLGRAIPAGLTPEQDIDSALDILFAHPNVAPFIGRQLIQRLVTSNPSPAYVARVAAVFDNNGAGVKGDLGSVIKAILLDQEARTGHLTAPGTFGKLKEPLLKLSALWRAFDVRGIRLQEQNGSISENRLRHRSTDRVFGQRPYGSPSVFNFYRPDYEHSGEIRDGGLHAPEFQIHTESQLISATNVIGWSIFSRDAEDPSTDAELVPGHRDSHPPRLYLADEKSLAVAPELLLDHINLLLMAGGMSTPMYNRILSLLKVRSTDSERARLGIVYDLLYLVCTSPEFAVQR
jgi:uncharacterized protein (DUF1800 family)